MGGSLFRMNVTNGNEVQPEEITVSFDDVRGVSTVAMFKLKPEHITVGTRAYKMGYVARACAVEYMI